MTPDVYDILNYPERGRNTALERTFKHLGVELIPFGKNRISGIPILGKGWSSLVVYGIFDNRKVAVKIQRKDSHRISLAREASILRTTNDYGIGPLLYVEGNKFLVLEYADGDPVGESTMKKEHILTFLEQCHQLDLLNIDHGQIQGGKHLLVGRKSWIIDFEKAGYRTPKNVTSLISELFLKKTVSAQRMCIHYGVDPEELMDAAHNYKRDFDIGGIVNAVFSR
ncbi:MAG: serine/threonine protein kinase [Theionarchaea archaeon]|nr:serine/threonine protein kinase [Theionarchaea archaeon]